MCPRTTASPQMVKVCLPTLFLQAFWLGWLVRGGGKRGAFLWGKVEVKVPGDWNLFVCVRILDFFCRRRAVAVIKIRTETLHLHFRFHWSRWRVGAKGGGFLAFLCRCGCIVNVELHKYAPSKQLIRGAERNTVYVFGLKRNTAMKMQIKVETRHLILYLRT